MRQTRVLPPAEWPRLVGTEAETLWPLLEPSRDRVVVVEEDGRIIGCTALYYVLHADCVWIHAEHRRRAGVARTLWRAVRHLARFLEERTLLVPVTLDVMRRFIEREHGVKIPADHYAVSLNEVPRGD